MRNCKRHSRHETAVICGCTERIGQMPRGRGAEVYRRAGTGPNADRTPGCAHPGPYWDGGRAAPIRRPVARRDDAALRLPAAVWPGAAFMGGAQGAVPRPRYPAAGRAGQDHALPAGEFEGVHDGQQRGSGAVIIWDEGTAEIVREEPGHARSSCTDASSRGVRADRTGAQRWILVKVRDEDARPGSDVVTERPASVRSGRTWQELRTGSNPRPERSHPRARGHRPPSRCSKRTQARARTRSRLDERAAPFDVYQRGREWPTGPTVNAT